MAYDADFDRVEASVILIVKPRPGQPPRRIQLRTSQPRAGSRAIEDRLAEDAIRLAQAMRGRQPAGRAEQQATEPAAA